MPDTNPVELFTKKHLRLTNLASTANVLFYVYLVVFLLMMIFNFISYKVSPTDGSTTLSFDSIYADIIAPFQTLLGNFFQGVVTLIVLKSIHLSLNMIVETDVNYRINTTDSEAIDEE